MKLRAYRLLVMVLILILASACSQVIEQDKIDPADYLHLDPSPYYLYTPVNFTPDRKWPVFVGIHPEGGTGLDCWNTWQPYADQEEYVLVCPSLAEANGTWHRQSGMDTMARVLNQVARDVSIQDQFFFAGYSGGGQFVEAILLDYPQIVTGAAILAAPYYYAPDASAKQAPVLVMIGQSDDPVAIQSAQLYVEQLRQLGYSVTAEYPANVDHRLTRDMIQKTLQLYRQVYSGAEP